MRLWIKGGATTCKSHEIYVQPGNAHPETSDFLDSEGKAIMFEVEFIYGQTKDLPDNLARYMIDQGLAQETRFITLG